ncbi:hypothetical protein ACLOJK_028163 [Asimina triloba]
MVEPGSLVGGQLLLLSYTWLPPLFAPFSVKKKSLIEKVQATFHQWEHVASSAGDWIHLTKELVAACETVEWEVDELDRAISVAARDPALYGIDKVELEKRRRWTNDAKNQVRNMQKLVVARKEESNPIITSSLGMRSDLLALPNSHSSQPGKSNQYYTRENNDFISSETDKQLLLARQQDEVLDELNASVRRIGDIGLTINDELAGQERILTDLGFEMNSITNRLDFLQVSFSAHSGKRNISLTLTACGTLSKQQQERKPFTSFCIYLQMGGVELVLECTLGQFFRGA